MSGINTFKRRLRGLVNEHFPSEECMESVALFLYRLSLDALRDCEDVTEEILRSRSIQPDEEMLFRKNIKDMVLFSSHNIINETIREAFIQLRYAIPLAKVGKSEPHGSASVCDSRVTPTKTGRRNFFESNSVEFDDLDFESIPKADDLRAGTVVSDSSTESREEDDLPFIIPKELDTGKDTSFMTDASIFTSGEYTSVPKITIDLDY